MAIHDIPLTFAQESLKTNQRSATDFNFGQDGLGYS
jgi:hypothetical protein